MAFVSHLATSAVQDMIFTDVSSRELRETLKPYPIFALYLFGLFGPPKERFCLFSSIIFIILLFSPFLPSCMGEITTPTKQKEVILAPHISTREVSSVCCVHTCRKVLVTSIYDSFFLESTSYMLARFQSKKK